MSSEHHSREPAAVRRQKIVSLTGSRGFVRPSDIADVFAVSEETARRDLAALAQAGQLERVHGGAVLHSSSQEAEPARAARSVSMLGAKQEIAKMAADLIGIEDTVFLDVGTTNEKVAEALPSGFKGTVVTNNLSAAVCLSRRDLVKVHVVGGLLRNEEATTYGPDALEAIMSFHADVAFIGCGAVCVSSGVTDFTSEDIPLKRAMIGNSRRSFVLATAEKVGKTATRMVCPLSDISGLVTDSTLSAMQLDELRASGTRVFNSRSTLD